MISNKSNIFLVDQGFNQKRELMENLYNNALHALMLFLCLSWWYLNLLDPLEFF